MKTNFKLLLFTGLSFIPMSLFVSCSDDTESKTTVSPPIEIIMSTAESKALTKASDFGLEVFKTMCLQSSDAENIFMSPLSTSMCLSMICNGTEGKTQSEILKALGYEGDSSGLEALNSMNGQLTATLPKTDKTANLILANSVWGENDIVFKNTFRKSMMSFYNADLYNAPLSTSEGIQMVNDWVFEKTFGLIPNIISSETYLCLLNALYFKGIWTNKFNASLTAEENFTCENGIQHKVQMMKSKEVLRYTETPDFQIASKTFGNGAFQIYFLLPKQVLLSEYLNSLTVSNWESWKKTMLPKYLDVKMPKFSICGEYNLIPVFENMGMTTAFSSGSNISGIMENGDAIFSIIRQKTQIEINENGVEAASATAATIETANPVAPLKFYLNKPFVLLITEHSTGAILFAGKVGSL